LGCRYGGYGSAAQQRDLAEVCTVRKRSGRGRGGGGKVAGPSDEGRHRQRKVLQVSPYCGGVEPSVGAWYQRTEMRELDGKGGKVRVQFPAIS